MHKIELHPDRKYFLQCGSENLLEAALTAGFSVNYGCTNGNCGLCKAKLLQGKIEKSRFSDYVISAQEKQENYFLLCSHRAASDIAIEVHQAHSSADIPLQKIKTRIKKIDRTTENISMLYIQTPRTKTLRFLAGQFAKLEVNNFATYLAIASCPCDERNLQFHIQRGVDEFAEYANTKLKSTEMILLNGPMGNFILDDTAAISRIFIAYESGFAPIKSLIEHSLSLDDNGRIKLILFHKDKHHYQHNLCRSWQDALENFDYQPFQSLDADKDAQSVLTNLQRMSKPIKLHNIYIAGPNQFGNTVAGLINHEYGDSNNIKIYGTEI